MNRKLILALAAAGCMAMFASNPAKADLKLCNNTQSVVQVAIGYKDKEGWASEGWWTAKPSACISILKGALIARYYYVFAVDKEHGGSWGGKALVCIKDKIFTIRGIDHCAERGYQQQGFFEVDTGEKPDWTVNLTGDKPAAPQATNAPAPAQQPAPADPNAPAPIPDPGKPATGTTQ